jgi:hypothetical protein
MISKYRVKTIRLLNLYKVLIQISFSQIGKSKALLSVGYGFLGTTIQVTAISLALKYVSHAIAGHEFKIFNHSLTFNDSELLLYSTALICFLMLLISSFLNYLSYKHIIEIGAKSELKAFSGLADKVFNNETFVLPHHEGKSSTNIIMRGLTADSRAIGRATQVVFLMVVPFCTVVGSVIVLFYLQPAVTSFLIPISGLMGYLVYNANKWSISTSKKFEKTQIEFAKLMGSALLKNAISFNKGTIVGNQSLTNEQIKMATDSTNSFSNLVLIPHRSALISDLFLALALSFTFTFLASSAISGSLSWTAIAGYLIAIRYGTTSLRTLLARFAVLNRFLPQVERWNDLQRSEKREYLPIPSSNLLKLKIVGLGEFTWSKEAPIYIFSSQYLNRFEIMRLMSLLTSEGNDLLSYFKPIYAREFQVDQNSVNLLIYDQGGWQEKAPTINHWKLVTTVKAEDIPKTSSQILLFDQGKIIWFGNEKSFFEEKVYLRVSKVKGDATNNQFNEPIDDFIDD